MGMIENYIATLSPEERELHKDLIEECRQREAELESLNRRGRDEKISDIYAGIKRIVMDIQNFLIPLERLKKV